MTHHIIYKTTNIINNKIYVGKHVTDNMEDGYLGSGTVLQRAISKYGQDKFKREVLFECANRDEMNKLEAEIVDEDFIARLDTYNLVLGGCGGTQHMNGVNHNNRNNHRRTGFLKHLDRGDPNPSHTARAQYSPAQKEALYRKISNSMKVHLKERGSGYFRGKKHTDATKRIIGEKNSVHQRGKGNSQYGTCWVYHEGEAISKKISKRDLDHWLDKGWKKGRKIKWGVHTQG